MVTLHTSFGDITITLFEDKAPLTVANFLRYAKEGFYDNTLFHRVIPNFMVQGGGFDPDMEQKETHEAIPNEATNQIRNTRGTVAMARTNDPHSATSQFFINGQDNEFLDFRNESTNGWGYCVFAEVTSGIEVIDEIEKVKTSTHGYHADVPVEPVILKSVTIAE